MYGLQQRKKQAYSSRATSEAPSLSAGFAPGAGQSQFGGQGQQGQSQVPTEKEEEDEYKLIYHQTYKACAFVFRKQFALAALGQEVLRDTVDKFLALFCSPPVLDLAAGTEMTESTTCGEGNMGMVFDRPSAAGAKEVENVTPVRSQKSER